MPISDLAVGSTPKPSFWGGLKKTFSNVDFQVGALGAASGIATNYASAAQAQKQMDFQKMMSDTAHQRQVKDLIAAGLNPILAAGGKGASSPGGAMAQMKDPTQSASTAYMQRQQLKNLREQRNTMFQQQNLLMAQQDASTAQAAKTRVENVLLSKQYNLADTDSRWYGSTVGQTARQIHLAAQTAASVTGAILPWKLALSKKTKTKRTGSDIRNSTYSRNMGL